jgi:hypothetical protein
MIKDRRVKGKSVLRSRMRAVEFESTVAPGGQITLPPEVASEFPPGEHLHVVVMWEPSNLDLAWRTAGRQRFEAAYIPADDVYEQSIDDSEIR